MKNCPTCNALVVTAEFNEIVARQPQVAGESCRIKLGEGAEGAVYRVGENMVVKLWHGPLFTDGEEPTPERVVKRFMDVMRMVELLPPDLRQVVRVPELVGYEGSIMWGFARDFKTFHEYVDGNPWYQVEDGQRFAPIIARLQDFFIDVQGTNILVKDGRVYLIDVAASSVKLREFAERQEILDKYTEERYNLDRRAQPDDEDLETPVVVDSTAV